MKLGATISYRQLGTGLSLRFNQGYFVLEVFVSHHKKIYLPEGFYIPNNSIHKAFCGEILGRYDKCMEIESMPT